MKHKSSILRMSVVAVSISVMLNAADIYEKLPTLYKSEIEYDKNEETITKTTKSLGQVVAFTSVTYDQNSNQYPIVQTGQYGLHKFNCEMTEKGDYNKEAKYDPERGKKIFEELQSELLSKQPGIIIKPANKQKE